MRQPLQIVEVQVPRCSLRFGTAPCPGASGAPCYNTWATCPTEATRAVYADTGRIRWRFVANQPGLFDFGDFSVADDVATHGIPVTGLQVTTSKAQINIGGMLDGKSPFGVRATCQVTMQDPVWTDVWGDFYPGLRSARPDRTFWSVFKARVKLYSNITLVIYDGYAGDALSAMRRRQYVLEAIDGPERGQVTLRGIDPLMLADRTRAQFPPSLTMSLLTQLTPDATTARIVVQSASDLSTIMGLTAKRFLVIGAEIIAYDAWTLVEPGIYDVSGLQRGQGGTVPAKADAGAAVGRAGHFDDRFLGDIGLYLLQEWTAIKDAWIDLTGWAAEQTDWLGLFSCGQVFVTAPTAVEDLMGELCQQGPYFVWWDEGARLVRMQAVRPATAAVPLLTGDGHILADSAAVREMPEARLSRVFVYWGRKVATSSGRDNWANLEGIVDGNGELPQAGGEPRLAELYGRFVATSAHAFALASRLMLFYATTPRQLTVDVSAKDRDIDPGEAVDVLSRSVVDADGVPVQERWLVTSWAELVAGQTYRLTGQSFNVTGRWAFMMDTSAPDYAAASTAERAAGGFMTGTDGLMADGSSGYVMQ